VGLEKQQRKGVGEVVTESPPPKKKEEGEKRGVHHRNHSHVFDLVVKNTNRTKHEIQEFGKSVETESGTTKKRKIEDVQEESNKRRDTPYHGQDRNDENYGQNRTLLWYLEERSPWLKTGGRTKGKDNRKVNALT